MVEKDTRGTNHLSPLNKTTTPNLWYNQLILTFGLPQRIVYWIQEGKMPQQHDSGTHTPKSTDQASTTQVVNTGRRKKTKRPWSMSRFLLSGHILEGPKPKTVWVGRAMVWSCRSTGKVHGGSSREPASRLSRHKMDQTCSHPFH